jgi:hypothetical protein
MAGSRMPLDTPLRAGTIALLAAAASMAARPAPAAAPGYEIQVGVIESDNIERLPTGGTDETIGVAELGFTWHDKRPWLDADIDADMSHLNYFQHAYGDEFIGSFLGQAQIKLAPQLLSWDITDNFGQAPLEPLAPVTPGNRENINYFSTGPALSLPLGQATQLGVTGQYGRMDYQHSPLDNTVLTGAVGLLHDLSPLSSISINARDESIRFANDQLNPNYDTQEAFARFDTKGSRTELGIDLGYSHVRIPGASGSTPLARLDITRRVAADSTIGVALGHDYSGGADSFRLVQTVGGATLNTLPILAAGAPFVGNYGTLAWNFKRARTTLSVSASYFRDRYQTDASLDNDRTVVEALAARQITPTLQLSLTEYMVRWQFTSEGDNATATDTGLALTWRVGSRVSVFVAYYLSKGTGNIPGFEYTENRLWLSIGYGRAAEVPPGPAPLRLPGLQPGMQ